MKVSVARLPSQDDLDKFVLRCVNDGLETASVYTVLSTNTYRSNLRTMAYNLYYGKIDLDDFVMIGEVVVDRQLRRAWSSGLKIVGLQTSDMTEGEKQALDQGLIMEKARLRGLGQFVLDTKRSGRSYRSVLPRIEMWVVRWLDFQNRATRMASNDPKLMWKLGPTEEHCPSCSKLAGRVKRASYWTKKDVHPQSPPNPKLSCKGYKCLCELVPTKEALTKGPLPKLP